ncbi:MAG: DUF3179 domain-containing protein [Planctomycetes bacterium]|nr:DUF3179 domain-containing protein [Planctomycetota bacterium]
MTNQQVTVGSDTRLFTFRSGGWVLLAAAFCSLFILVWALRGVFTREPPIGNGRDVATYNFDLASCNIPQNEIIAGGLAKDVLVAMVNPPTMPGSGIVELNSDIHYGKYLVTKDLVIGVTVNGESRGYPMQILTCHEIVNDTLGGKPIVVTYNPLCDSVVVFERNVDGETLEFGVSGLLYNSNILMFDRKENAVGESLWSQLLGRAVAGPAAESGKKLKVLPAARLHWGEWLEAHPQSTVLALDLSMVKRYQETSYHSYFTSSKLMFEVKPPPPTDGLPVKQRLLIVDTPDGRRVYPLTWISDQADDSGRWTDTTLSTPIDFICSKDPLAVFIDQSSDNNTINVRYAMWFAWHAMYPEDVPLGNDG